MSSARWTTGIGTGTPEPELKRLEPSGAHPRCYGAPTVSRGERQVRFLLQRLATSPLVSESCPLVGVDEGDLDDLERRLGFALPAPYRMFLRHAGRRAGTFMQGSDFAFADLINLQVVAMEIAEDVGLSLPHDAFVFLMHQGYEFLFFCHAREDAPIFRASDAGELAEVAPSFVHWLELAIADEVRAFFLVGS